MSATTIWAVQDALKSLLDADTTLTAAGVARSLGWPVGGPEREHVWIAGAVERSQQEPVITTAANPRRKETYQLAIHTLVRWEDDEYLKVRNRIKTLTDAIELVVQGDHALNGTVFFAQVDSHEVEEGVEEKARTIGVTIRIAIAAYING